EKFYAPQGEIEFKYLEGAVYSLLKCGECDLIFQREIPNDDLMERLYEHWIEPPKALLVALERGFPATYCSYAQEIMRIVAYLGKPPSSLHFLDFGMGWGQWAFMAKAFGCDAYGTELSRTRIDHARHRGIEVMTMREASDLRF